MPGVEPIFTSTSIIHRYKNNELLGCATGFFFKDKEDNLFLVTNRHVIYGDAYLENLTPEIDSMKLILHTNVQDLLKNEEVEIPLFDKDKKIWLEHKDRTVDVILIPLNIDINKYVLLVLDESWIDWSDIDVFLDTVIFVIGYPYAWYDKTRNLPITRVGYFASPPRVWFQNKPLMIGDVETHPGMSGGPVFLTIRNPVSSDGGKATMKLGQRRTALIGIHSGGPIWGFKNKKTGDKKVVIPSLINIWMSELILEILYS